MNIEMFIVMFPVSKYESLGSSGQAWDKLRYSGRRQKQRAGAVHVEVFFMRVHQPRHLTCEDVP